MTWSGGALGERGQCVLAPNAADDPRRHQHLGAGEPGSSRSVVVDPGPSIMSHLDEVERRPVTSPPCCSRHHHADHPKRPPRVRGRVGCGVRAGGCWIPRTVWGRRSQRGGRGVLDGLEIRVVATPGASYDSLRSAAGRGRVLTGDTVLGPAPRSSSIPADSSGDYLTPSTGCASSQDARLHHLARGTAR